MRWKIPWTGSSNVDSAPCAFVPTPEYVRGTMSRSEEECGTYTKLYIYTIIDGILLLDG